MRSIHHARRCLAAFVSLGVVAATAAQDAPADPLRALQAAQIDDRDVSRPRPWSFGWQGLDGVYSTHRTHSNRPVLALTFGAFAELADRTGPASRFRSAERAAELFGGSTPPRTVDPRQVHLDQTELHDVMLGAVDRGARRVVVLVMDGADWQTYAAASTVLHGVHDSEGPGRGLPWFEFVPPAGAGRGYASVVTSPLRGSGAPPGYDVDRAGVHPWSAQDLAYLAGDYRVDRGADGREIPAFDRARVHAVTDSAASATSIFAGIKTRNGYVNVDGAGQRVEPLGRRLQARGFAIATVTDVPFAHATPAAVYASADNRSKYRELGRQMLGLEDYAGVDVVLGYGHDFDARGRYLAAEDLERLVADGIYRVVLPGADVGARLAATAAEVGAARRAVAPRGTRLFGCFGAPGLDHAPLRTADGGYDPVASLDYGSGALAAAPDHDAALLAAQPTLLELTRAAAAVLEATPERPFLLLVEAGQVDWALHANNLDDAIGEVRSAAEVFTFLTGWIGERGWWDDTLLLVTSDHGHLLNVDLAALHAAVHGARGDAAHIRR